MDAAQAIAELERQRVEGTRDDLLGTVYGALVALLQELVARPRQIARAASSANTTAPQGSVGGDLGGALPNPQVVSVQGQPWDAAVLGLAELGLVPRWTGERWVAGSVAASLAPLTRTRFVDAATAVPTAQQTGQEWAPYATEQQAMSEIAAGPLDQDWAVVIRRPSGLGFSVPYRRRIVVRGEFRAAVVGAITWQIGGPDGSSVLNLRNLQCGAITVSDHSSGPTTFAIAALESVICAGIDNVTSGSASQLHLLATGTVPNYVSTTTSTSGQFSGPIKITGLAALLNVETQDTQAVQAAGLLARNVAFGGNVTLTDKTCELVSVTWKQPAPSLAFVGDPGVLQADSLSTYNARQVGLAVTGGKVAPYVDQQAGPFSIAIATEGALYYASGGGAADLAKADSLATSRVLGVYANRGGSLGSVQGHVYPVLFRPGLSLAVDQPAYLSPDFAGMATNIEPTADGQFICSLGTILDTSGYNALLGGLVLVELAFAPVQSTESVGEEVVLGALDTSGIWFPLEWIGPASGSTSTPTADAVFGFGCGFWVVRADGTLRDLWLTNASPSSSDFDFDVWVAPGGNPGAFAYSGVTISVPANQHAVFGAAELALQEGDLVGLRNASALIGYTSGGLSITARFRRN